MSDRVVCPAPPARASARALRAGCACFRERRNSNRIRGRASRAPAKAKAGARARARGAPPAARAARGGTRPKGVARGPIRRKGHFGKRHGRKRGRATRERAQRPRWERAQAQAGTHHADTSVGVGWGGEEGDALAGHHRLRGRAAPCPATTAGKSSPHPPLPGGLRGAWEGAHARTARARHQRRHRGRRREAPVPRGDGAPRAGRRARGARRGEGARGRRGGAAADAVGRGGVPARPPGELHVPRTLRGAHPAASERASEREGNGETESHPPWHRLAVGVLSQCVGLSVARRT